MFDSSNLSETHGIKNLPLKEVKAAALDDNKKTHAICTCIYAYNLKGSSRTYRYRSYRAKPCYHTLWVYLRAPWLPQAPGFDHRCSNDSIDFHRHHGLEHRGSNKPRSFKHHGSNTHPLEHRGSNDHRGLNKHRGFTEHRGSHKHRGFTEHRGSTQFHTRHRVATRAKLQYTRLAYALSSTSLSHLILISLLSIVPGSYFTRKQLPIDLVACYYFIIHGISVDSTEPQIYVSNYFCRNVTVLNNVIQGFLDLP
jgi:hypothetical protein